MKKLNKTLDVVTVVVSWLAAFAIMVVPLAPNTKITNKISYTLFILIVTAVAVFYTVLFMCNRQDERNKKLLDELIE